ATARTPGRKRWRSYQRVAREYDITTPGYTGSTGRDQRIHPQPAGRLSVAVDRRQGRLGLRHVRQVWVHVHLMPELGRDDADHAHLHGDALLGPGRHLPDPLPPGRDGGRVEVRRFAQGLLAEQLLHESRRGLGVEAVERGPEHGLAPPGDGVRQPALGEEPQYV